MSNVRWTPLSMSGRGAESLGQCNAERAPRRIGQVRRHERVVSVADFPELLGIAEVSGGEMIEPLALGDAVFLQRGEILRWRHEAATETGDGTAVRGDELHDLDVVITAGRRELAALAKLREESEGIVVHGMPLMPSAPNAPLAFFWARRSRAWW